MDQYWRDFVSLDSRGNKVRLELFLQVVPMYILGGLGHEQFVMAEKRALRSYCDERRDPIGSFDCVS